MTSPVGLRRLPYPYRAMLAICSDLDETPSRDVYFDTSRFLNTTAQTPWGPGLGLEVGNTIFFDMPPDQFAYWNTDDRGRAMVRTLIQSGHIDCLHSFGDGTTRAHAARALDELDRHGCRLETWVDHGVSPTNFGADIMRGSGDVPGSDAYHADLTSAFGVQYVWRGRATSVIGQNVPRRLGGIFAGRHPVASTRALTKECLKAWLARGGSHKYARHASNEVSWPVVLRSGHSVVEFCRSNPSWGGISHNDTGRGIGAVLTDAMLERLVHREGTMILYTHLGKTGPEHAGLPVSARVGLARLARFHDERKILVTTTRRVLGYCRAAGEVSVSATDDHGARRVDLRTTSRPSVAPLAPTDLSGLTVYVPDPERTSLAVNGRVVDEIRANPPDHTGRRSVSIPWKPLEFPTV